MEVYANIAFLLQNALGLLIFDTAVRHRALEWNIATQPCSAGHTDLQQRCYARASGHIEFVTVTWLFATLMLGLLSICSRHPAPALVGTGLAFAAATWTNVYEAECAVLCAAAPCGDCFRLNTTTVRTELVVAFCVYAACGGLLALNVHRASARNAILQ